MAQQDKTDWYWNGVLAGGAVNNLYYDLINVDVVPVPYATHHRNSSFFLKTRLAYSISKNWAEWEETSSFEITDIKIIRDEACDNMTWDVYVMWRNGTVKSIFAAPIQKYYDTDVGCVWVFHRCTEDDILESVECGNRKLFTTNYVKWSRILKEDTVAESDEILEVKSWTTATEVTGKWTWIQINRYIAGKSVWFFSDENVEIWYAKFRTDGLGLSPWKYLLAYQSRNLDWDWFAWQVRMITWISNDWLIMVDEPRLWLAVSSDDDEERWAWISYAIFDWWGEVVWFSANKNVEIIYQDCKHMSVYDQSNWRGSAKSQIIWVTEASNTIFVMTKNGYVHYNKDGWWYYNKFFINDDMYAWIDKTSIVSYRDTLIAFGRKHIWVWIPDDRWEYWTMYNQSNTTWVRSRYSYWEYDWDMIFVSNDKRLLALWVASTAWRYMLQYEDVWDMLNWKLSALRPWDEVYIGSDNNNLRVFCNFSSDPYTEYRWRADISPSLNNSSTHIYKFDILFKVWSEDHVSWHLIKWATEWIYYWEDWIYVRDDADVDCAYINNNWQRVWFPSPYYTDISAYLIESEADWTWWNSSRLANRPKLYNTAKLNRLLTILWPWIYSNNTKIKITTYSKWIWYTYEFPVNWEWNDWLWLMTSYYLEQNLTPDELEKIECMLSILQDGQTQYQPNCPEWDVMRQYISQTAPWCENYDTLITESHWICVNDKLYELAPTMPLTTSLWENQPYATQIKIELIWWEWDIISFGWRIWEMFVAPIFTTGPDWEYQLEPNTNC